MLGISGRKWFFISSVIESVSNLIGSDIGKLCGDKCIQHNPLFSNRSNYVYAHEKRTAKPDRFNCPILFTGAWLTTSANVAFVTWLDAKLSALL
jgi:hypothetical protein